MVPLLAVLAVACDDPAASADADAHPGSQPDASLPSYGQAELDVVALAVDTPDGQPATKGSPLRIHLTVKNRGKQAGSAVLVPHLTSRRFNDFVGVPLPALEVEVAAGAEATVSTEIGPFLASPDGGKRWALGAGDYTFDAVLVSRPGEAQVIDVAFAGAAFVIAPSNVVFTAVTYDPAYFVRIGWTGDVETFLREAYRRPSEVYHPADGSYTAYPGGFDEILGIEQQFDVVAGLAATSSAGGYCEQVASHAKGAFGLPRSWDIDERADHTDPDHHGYDMLVGLTPAMGGGAACGWLGVQVSSLFDFDLSIDRAQIVLVHESGHLFGAPHCDPEQGYVMCAGERHAHYQDDGVFVWHESSVAAMRNLWAD
jgi:hypothetical protein